MKILDIIGMIFVLFIDLLGDYSKDQFRVFEHHINRPVATPKVRRKKTQKHFLHLSHQFNCFRALYKTVWATPR